MLPTGGQHPPLRPRRGGTFIKGSWQGGPGAGAPVGGNRGFFDFYAHFHARRPIGGGEGEGGGSGGGDGDGGGGDGGGGAQGEGGAKGGSGDSDRGGEPEGGSAGGSGGRSGGGISIETNTPAVGFVQPPTAGRKTGRPGCARC